MSDSLHRTRHTEFLKRITSIESAVADAYYSLGQHYVGKRLAVVEHSFADLLNSLGKLKADQRPTIRERIASYIFQMLRKDDTGKLCAA